MIKYLVIIAVCLLWHNQRHIHEILDIIEHSMDAQPKERVDMINAALPQDVGEAANFNDLLDAIEWVESKGDANEVGDDGRAIGAYQIWKIYVDDLNRIKPIRYGYNQTINRFSYDDRLDPVKSREMVSIYLKHYGGTVEEMARKHNGGPNGHKKESIKKYWDKVRKVLENK